MELSPKELTELSKHAAKARRNLDNLLDFVDLMNNDSEKLEGDITPAGEQIKQLSNEMSKYVDEIKTLIDAQLDKIPINPEETKDAASKLGLYHGTIHQVISYADTEKSKHKENSYWWRYWVSILDNVMQQEIENPSKPIGQGKQGQGKPFLEKRK